MTKYLDYAFLSAALLAALPACTSTSSDPDEPVSATELKFAAVEDTRASITTNDKLINSPFAVYGNMVLTGSSNNPIVIFNGTNVSHNGSSWEYDDPQYWFPNHTFSFAAIHPANNEQITDISFQNGRLSFTYNYPEEYKDAVDILTASHKRVYASGPTSSVEFNFSHALARLNFIIKVDPAISGKVKITHLDMKNVGKNATYSFSLPSLTSGQTNDRINPTWSEPESQTETLFEITAPVEVEAGKTHEFFSISSTPNPLFVIPQNVNEDTEINITYKINDGSEVNATAKIYSTTVTSHSGRWQEGRAYSYSFSIGATDFILYGIPSVTEWDKDDGGNYIVAD